MQEISLIIRITNLQSYLIIISKLFQFDFLAQTLIYQAANFIALRLNYCIESFYMKPHSKTHLICFYSSL